MSDDADVHANPVPPEPNAAGDYVAVIPTGNPYGIAPSGPFAAVLNTTGGTFSGTLSGATFTVDPSHGLDEDYIAKIAKEQAERVTVECGGKAYEYDGAGRLVSVDAEPEPVVEPSPYGNPHLASLLSTTTTSTLHGLSSSTYKAWDAASSAGTTVKWTGNGTYFDPPAK